MNYQDIARMEQAEIQEIRTRYNEIRISLINSCSHGNLTGPLSRFLGSMDIYHRYCKVCRNCGREFACDRTGKVL